MWWHDWRRSLPDRRCKYVANYEQIVDQTIMGKITQTTTPQQFQQAQESLLRLKEEIMEHMAPHFPFTTGRHRCVEECYVEYSNRLRNLALMQPAPMPTPAREPGTTPEQVVAELEETVRLTPDETILGRDEPLPDEWSP
jgi:hypothetical protein